MAKGRYYGKKSSGKKMNDGYGMNGYYAKNKSMMITEDYNKPSNLPTDVVMKYYPPLDYLTQYVPDTIYGMDMQVNSAIKSARKQYAKKKY